ncbi:hypothetical protein ABIB29_000065 [Arthrobacter sp. UYEF36]
MCGACGRSVVSDPVLGPIRTLRLHLIVAQTVNGACQSWPGAPKVAATSIGWLVSGPTGVTEPVSTVEALWSAVLRGTPGARWQDLRRATDPETEDPEGEGLSLRVLKVGREMARSAGASRRAPLGQHDGGARRGESATETDSRHVDPRSGCLKSARNPPR